MTVLSFDCDCYITVSKKLTKLCVGLIDDFAKPCIRPAVGPIEYYNLIGAIQHDITGLCCYVPVTCRQCMTERSYLFETAVHGHVDS